MPKCILTGLANQLNQTTNVFLFTFVYMVYLVHLVYAVCMVHNRETQPQILSLWRSGRVWDSELSG